MKKLSIGKVLSTVILAIVTVTLLLATLGSYDDIKWYKDALEVARDERKNGKSTSTTVSVEGKEPLQEVFTFDQNCYINQRYSYSEGTDWTGAAKAMYDAVNVQLYRLILDSPVGATGITSKTEAKEYCINYINELPNVDNAIVYYEFIGDEYNGEWISLYDSFFYGDNVLKYLTASDMEMIQYILYNDYDLFRDYETRVIREWELIANNLRDGYNREMYTGSVAASDWDIEYYTDSYKSALTATSIFAVLTLMAFGGWIMLCYVNFVLHPRKVRAEIEERQARADRELLEARIEELPDEADELADKYLGED